jgi:hypothetical protein
MYCSFLDSNRFQSPHLQNGSPDTCKVSHQRHRGTARHLCEYLAERTKQQIHADKIALMSQHLRSPVSRRISPAGFCELLSLGEDYVEGAWKLSKVVHMPQDRDILFVVWRRKQEYDKPSYNNLSERHTLDAVRVWKRKLTQCQAWYFSMLLKEGCYTTEDLREKIEPFLSQDGARNVIAPTLLEGARKIISGDSEFVSDYVSFSI